MQLNKKMIFWMRLWAFVFSGLIMVVAQASTPLWTFNPLTATNLIVSANSTANIQYLMTNQSARTHTLIMEPLEGVTQITGGFGICGNPFVLASKGTCVLSLQANGAQLPHPIADGPVVCEKNSRLQCYRPGSESILRITQGPPVSDAVISVTGSPLALTANGPSSQLTITNQSTDIVATNITSDFTGTALEGNVTENANDCGSVLPGNSCTLVYTPGNAAVPLTAFTIKGTNTNTVTAQILIETTTLTSITPVTGPTMGGTGVTLTGTGLSGATSVVFDGAFFATSVNVIDAHTVTAVTPAHVAGLVNVFINTPSGGAALNNSFTYVANAVGESTSGGKIACLDGGLQSFIATNSNLSIPNLSLRWGGVTQLGNSTVTGAVSTTDGAANTATIVAVFDGLGVVGSVAQACANFEVDSQNFTPCRPGNTCYNDWFLAAIDQLNCIYTNRVAIGGINPQDGVYYWSSTETGALSASAQDFDTGFSPVNNGKLSVGQVRCIRPYTL